MQVAIKILFIYNRPLKVEITIPIILSAVLYDEIEIHP